MHAYAEASVRAHRSGNELDGGRFREPAFESGRRLLRLFGFFRFLALPVSVAHRGVLCVLKGWMRAGQVSRRQALRCNARQAHVNAVVVERGRERRVAGYLSLASMPSSCSSDE